MRVQRAVPFVPVLKGQNEAESAATQLTEWIGKWRADGWDFVRLESVTSIRPGGCLSGQSTVLSIQLAILERDAPGPGA